MARFIYVGNIERNAKLPYLISLWSGYYLAVLSVCAFALLNEWLGNSVKAFGGLIFTCMISLWLGNLAGHYLTQAQLHMARLIHLLIAASALALAPILLGDALAALVLGSRWSNNSATILIAGTLFAPPLLLLSAIPAYASTLMIRNRGSAGSVNDIILLCTALGYSAGTLITANYVINWLDARIVMKMMLAISAIVVLLGLLRYPPRKIRRR
jgi:hypothetical protein